MILAAPKALPSRKLVWVMRVLSLVAFVISGYLAWSAYRQSEVFGCGGGEIWDCGHVLHSRWAKWLGMPVSLPAMGMYFTVLIALAVCTMSSSSETARRLAWAVVTVGGLSAGIAAIWFISLQAFVLKKLCIYCMCAHCCGMVLSAIILWRRPLGKNITSALSGLSVIGACVLIAGQWLAPPPKTYAEERYDTVDFTSDEASAFAVDGEEADPFLIEPVEDLFEVPSEESTETEDRLGALPKTFPGSQPIPTQSPGLDGHANRGLADIVSRFSIQLAEEVTANLSADVDPACRGDAGFLEVDAQKFESSGAANADEPLIASESLPAAATREARSSTIDEVRVGHDPLTRHQLSTVAADELQRSLAEVASDLADLGIRESASTPTLASDLKHCASAAPSTPTSSESEVAAASSLAEKVPSVSESQTEAAPPADHQSILLKREAESIAIVGESLGIKPRAAPVNASPQSHPANSAAQSSSSERVTAERNLKPNAFASAVDVVVHDVRTSTSSKQSPTPATTPTPGESSEGTEAGQTSPAPPQPPQRNLVAVLGGRAKLDPRHWPLIGSTDANNVIVELFDYTCPHCRKMNQHIHEARQRYGSELALMALPVPLSRDCNDTVVSTKARHQAACELARLAIAVWRVNPAAFEVFHNWLFQPEHGRSSGEAWAYASQLVGAQPLQEEMSKSIVNQFISKHVELYKRAGQGTVPKLMFPTVTIRGEMSSADALCEVLERELFNK